MAEYEYLTDWDVIKHKWAISRCSSRADEVTCTGLALALEEIESFLAQTATVILPFETILEVAQSVNKFVIGAAGVAQLVLILKASINDTWSSFKLVMGEAFNADSSVVLETALLDLLAAASLSEVVSAFARDASEIIVAFALLDGALVVFKSEGTVAFRACMVCLFYFASEQIVVLAFIEDEWVLRNALLASVIWVIGLTVLHSDDAGTCRFDIAIGTVGACAIWAWLKTASIGGWVLSIGVEDVAFSIGKLILWIDKGVPGAQVAHSCTVRYCMQPSM